MTLYCNSLKHSSPSPTATAVLLSGDLKPRRRSLVNPRPPRLGGAASGEHRTSTLTSGEAGHWEIGVRRSWLREVGGGGVRRERDAGHREVSIGRSGLGQAGGRIRRSLTSWWLWSGALVGIVVRELDFVFFIFIGRKEELGPGHGGWPRGLERATKMKSISFPWKILEGTVEPLIKDN